MKPIALPATIFTAACLLASCCCSSSRSGNQPRTLFNGRDLSGWKAVSADASIPADSVWTVRDGTLICRGEPLGFLHTEQSFTNFRLTVEYRWAPGKPPGNSGLFSRINGPAKALPRCVEVQLKHGNAGDVLGLQGLKIAAGQPRHFHVDKHELAGDIDGIRHTENAEKPAGEWNRVEYRAQGDTYTVWINGKQVNHVTGVENATGPVGLQSEGGEIHFRNLTLTALP